MHAMTLHVPVHECQGTGAVECIGKIYKFEKKKKKIKSKICETSKKKVKKSITVIMIK